MAGRKRIRRTERMLYYQKKKEIEHVRKDLKKGNVP
jgi:hypothetical protein